MLQDDQEPLASATPGVRQRGRLRGSKAELSWLLRTTYIQNDSHEQRVQGISEKQAKDLRQAELPQAADDREAQIAMIEVRPLRSCILTAG